MLLLDSLADQETEPDVERDDRVLDEFVEPPHRIKVAFLNDVRGIDTSPESMIQAQSHHPPEPVAIPFEQLGNGNPVARSGERDKVRNLPWGWRHLIHTKKP